jgi:hypothetical protein
MRLGRRLSEYLLNIRETCTAFLTGKRGGFFEVFLESGDVRAMGRRGIFEVAKQYGIGRRIHLAGEKMRVGRDVDPQIGDSLADLGIVRHHREGTGIGLAFIAAAGTAIERGFERVIVRSAPVAANEDEQGKRSIKHED